MKTMNTIETTEHEHEYQDDEDIVRNECIVSLRRLSMGSTVFQEDNTILDDSCKQNRVGSQDVQIGMIIGTGCFSNVSELRGIKASSTSSAISEISENVDDNSQPTNLPEKKNYNFAVKKLRGDLTGSNWKNGAIDLAVEAQFLTSLSHKNIVKLQAMGDDPGGKNFFIVIDRLERTLSDAIKGWRHRKSLIKNGRIPSNSKEGPERMILSQLDNIILPFARDISSALKYLHNKNIIFRDLKPENVGIDFDNNLKLFDFGLARELREESRVGRNQFLVSIAGTPRYMGPEVLAGKPYGLPADVYSFAMLLWEMVHHEHPFDRLSRGQHKRAVLLWRYRPKVKSSTPREMSYLLKRSWNHSPRKRPSISEVYDEIGMYLSRNS